MAISYNTLLLYIFQFLSPKDIVFLLQRQGKAQFKVPLAICHPHEEEQVKAWACTHAHGKEQLYRYWF